jgi:hypothetical protein
MGSIEQDLLQETRLSTADLTRAAVRRQEMGNRLETTVLELGLLSETELVPALAAHYGLPAATLEDLREIPDSIQNLLSPEQAASYRAVPFAAGPGRADVATAGDLDLEKADELAFLLGRRVRLFVINEVRIAQALHKYYQQPQAARLLNLADRLDRGLGRSMDLADSAAKTTAGPGSQPAPAASAGALGELLARRRGLESSRRVTPPKPREVLQTISLSDDERQAIFGSTEPEGVEEDAEIQVPASDLAKLSHDLQEANSPTAVGEAFLQYLESFFLNTILLRPEGELFRGWLARGPEVDRAELRGLMTGPGLAAEWRQILAEEDAVPTALGASAEAGGFGPQLGLEAGGSIVLVPVRVQERVVSLAVGSPKQELGGNVKELLGNASLRTGLALQSWILRQKHHAAKPS